MRTASVCLLAALTLAASARAQDQPVEPRLLVLTPAPLPARTPRLLPERLDGRAGNAAEHYHKAAEQLRKGRLGGDNERLDAYRQTPLDQLPLDDLRALLAHYRDALAEVEAGSRCDTCDWGLEEQLRKDSFGVLLPDHQELRFAALVLATRLRLELAEGHTDRALRTARTSLAMSRHVADAPVLICMLIGVASAATTLEALEDALQRPDAPNLYRALSDLPRPFVDVRRPLEGERLSAYSYFPGLGDHRDPDSPPLTPEQVKALSDKVVGAKPELGRLAPNRAVLAALLLARHEAARHALVAAGWPTDKADALPHLQAVLLHGLLEYDRATQEMLSWQALPYWEAAPKLREAERQRRERQRQARKNNEAPLFPLTDLLLPAGARVLNARTRMDRRIAALTVVEAVRLHAAATGKLPASLEEVRAVPVPPDPATGRPFAYKLDGDKARLSGAPLPGERPSRGTVISYVLTLRK
jgi:hypothetical protein